MIERRRIGPVLVWTAGVILPLLLWTAGGWALPAQRPGTGAWGLLALGQGSGLVGMAMASVSVVLSARVRGLEGFFGGLDGMYRTHHRVGLAAFGGLLLHPVALALRFVPADWGRAVAFLLPGHARWAVDLGVYALWAMILLLVLTLTAWLPYDTWKHSHKGLALVLLGGAVHMWFVEGTRGMSVAVVEHGGLRGYMTGLVGLGLAAAVYKTVVLPLWPTPRYTVSDVERLNDDVVEVTLTPQDEPLDFVPGQFVFVTFYGAGLTRESHPYTPCGPADAETLTITVKALGDYTRRLYERLDTGVEAVLEGPYGRFDYRDGGTRQIWIAGGVGVAPFLSWSRNMARSGEAACDVDFYYCVHDRGDAVYREEFEAIGRALPGLNVALVCSMEEGHLHADDVGDVAGADVFMCGPKRLTTDLRRQFRRRGVPDRRIHYEDFEFR
jgi:predicted ferric reductase